MRLHKATFQLTTDGWRPYENAVAYSLGTRVDYAMLIKVCAKDREGEQKYSPPELEVEKQKLELENQRLDLDIRKERTAKLQIVLPIAVSIIAIMVSSLNEWRRSREAAQQFEWQWRAKAEDYAEGRDIRRRESSCLRN